MWLFPRTLRQASIELFAAACVVLVAMAPAEAALYKWTDANGRTVYSDTPPLGDVKTERMTGPSPPANPNALKEMLNQETELKKRQTQRAEDAVKADKARSDVARKQDACTQLRGQLKGFADPNTRYYRYNEKGERLMMDAAEVKREHDRVEAIIKEKC